MFVLAKGVDDTPVELGRVPAGGVNGRWLSRLDTGKRDARGTYVAARVWMRIVATADLHFGKSSTGTLQVLLSQITTDADVLVVAGDITDYGTVDEARSFARELSASVRIPIVAVLGNHDFESGRRAGDSSDTRRPRRVCAGWRYM